MVLLLVVFLIEKAVVAIVMVAVAAFLVVLLVLRVLLWFPRLVPSLLTGLPLLSVAAAVPAATGFGCSL